jgi:hypothetical protein
MRSKACRRKSLGVIFCRHIPTTNKAAARRLACRRLWLSCHYPLQMSKRQRDDTQGMARDAKMVAKFHL